MEPADVNASRVATLPGGGECRLTIARDLATP